MTSPRTSVDRPAVVLGVAGTGGAVIALTQDEWLWAAILFLGSMVVELLVSISTTSASTRRSDSMTPGVPT